MAIIKVKAKQLSEWGRKKQNYFKDIMKVNII